MGQPKFKAGDKVQMTPETAKVNDAARSFTGVIIGLSRRPRTVRLKRDGLKSIELWHEDAWERLTTTQQKEGE